MGPGTFAWNELLTSDVEAAKRFYAQAVGWHFEPMQMNDRTYWVAKLADRPVAGIMDMEGVTPPGAPPHWFSYLEVEDVDRLAAAIESNGGRLLKPLFDIPGVGRIAIVSDHAGAVMGWMTPRR